jgi:hypothetical protein
MARLEPNPPAPAADRRPFWQPIGRLVFAFGDLETHIDRCISVLLHAGASHGPSVASQIRNICSRIALLEALFRQHTAERKRRAELHGLIKELRALIKFRNGVLHGPWGAYLEDGRTWQKPRTDPRDLSPGAFEVTVEAIEEHITRAAQVGEAISKLVRQVAEETAGRALHMP